MKTDYECATIIDDSDSSDEEYILMPKAKTIKKRVTKPQAVLKKCHNEAENVYEIGVDEVGRGPMFGRVYTAAVILPKDDSFDCSMVKDSKKFHSKKKIEEAAQYVKDHALAWYISFEDEKKIDEINILQATQLSMHNSIGEVRKKANQIFKADGKEYSYSLLIDGNYFNPITFVNKKTNKIEVIPYMHLLLLHLFWQRLNAIDILMSCVNKTQHCANIMVLIQTKVMVQKDIWME
jgi:ribonuclease HII